MTKNNGKNNWQTLWRSAEMKTLIILVAHLDGDVPIVEEM